MNSIYGRSNIYSDILVFNWLTWVDLFWLAPLALLAGWAWFYSAWAMAAFLASRGIWLSMIPR